MSWVAATLPSSDFWSIPAYGNGYWVVVANTNKSAYSATGSSWTATTLTTTTNTWSTLLFDGTQHIAFDSNGQFAVSTDGAHSWGTLNTSLSSTGGVNGITNVVYGSGTYVQINQYTGTVNYTNNLTSWFNTSCAHGANSCTWDSVHSVFIAVGNNATATNTSLIGTSSGASWSTGAMTASLAWSSIACDGAGTCIAIAAGTNGASATANKTTNGGTTWTAITLPSSHNWQAISYISGTWMIVAYNSNSTLYSTNGGTTWTAATTTVVADWFACGAGNGQFITTGLNSSFGNTNIANLYQASTGISIAFGGQTITSTEGLLVPNNTRNLNSQIGNFTEGSFTVSNGNLSFQLGSFTITSTEGSLTPQHSNTFASQLASFTEGTVVPNVSLSYLSQIVNLSEGIFSPSVSYALGSQAGTFAEGTIVPSSAVSLTGQNLVSSEGSLSVQTSLVFGGQLLSSTEGSFTPTTGQTIVFTGFQLASAEGSLSPLVSLSLTGTQLYSHFGILTYVSLSQKASIFQLIIQPSERGMYARESLIENYIPISNYMLSITPPGNELYVPLVSYNMEISK